MSKIYDRLEGDAQASADLKLVELIKKYSFPQTELQVQYVALDAPFQLPLCANCKLNCPSFDNCKEPHILWMWQQTKKKQKNKKTKKAFTPYTQKSIELYFEQDLEEIFHRGDALGANLAPLTMRAHFLSRQIKQPLIEVYPRLSFWRMGRDLKIMKRHLRNHRSSLGGEESRRVFLKELTEKKMVFLYQQDYKIMLEDPYAFDAFLGAMTGFLKYNDLTEPRVESFPHGEDWVDFPKTQLNLLSLLSKEV